MQRRRTDSEVQPAFHVRDISLTAWHGMAWHGLVLLLLLLLLLASSLARWLADRYYCCYCKIYIYRNTAITPMHIIKNHRSMDKRPRDLSTGIKWNKNCMVYGVEPLWLYDNLNEIHNSIRNAAWNGVQFGSITCKLVGIVGWLAGRAGWNIQFKWKRISPQLLFFFLETFFFFIFVWWLCDRTKRRKLGNWVTIINVINIFL